MYTKAYSIKLTVFVDFRKEYSSDSFYQIDRTIEGFMEQNLVELYEHRHTDAEMKGSIETLWDIFGGTINSKGYKVLNPRVGLIYGDSITLQRYQEILKRLEA